MENQLLDLVNAKLTEKFPSDIYSAEMLYDYPVFTVNRDKVLEIVRFLYDDPEMSFQFLTTLCGLHFPDNKGKEIGVMYQLHNLPENKRIRLKTFFGEKDCYVSTITSVFKAANWQERETYDFFGIEFKGHPNLKRIVNMDELVGWPLRKEFPLEDPTREDKNDAMFGR